MWSRIRWIIFGIFKFIWIKHIRKNRSNKWVERKYLNIVEKMMDLKYMFQFVFSFVFSRWIKNIDQRRRTVKLIMRWNIFHIFNLFQSIQINDRRKVFMKEKVIEYSFERKLFQCDEYFVDHFSLEISFEKWKKGSTRP